jgi:outer membrane protein assembly factor BamD (BamD/ComL family)
MIPFADRFPLFRVLAILVIACAATTGAVQAQQDEELPRRRLESGREYLRTKNYAEALKDFEAILQSYPSSSVADDALLEIATYQLDVARDPAAADASVKNLLKTYPAADAAAKALVLQGRVLLELGREPEDVNAAIASFERVARLFPGNEAVPASMFYAGLAARLGGRADEAIERHTQLAIQYPTSPWTARALLGVARSLTAAGQPLRAVEQLQRVRNQFSDTPAAATALEWNTILYRLYIRAPAQPAYVFSGRTLAGPGGKIKDVRAVAVDAENNVLVTTDKAVSVYGATGAQLRTITAPEARGVFFDRLGNVLTIYETGIRGEDRSTLRLAIAGSDGRPRELKVEAGAVTSLGDYLIADEEAKAILRFGSDGKFKGDFAKQINARRLAITDLDEVAALDRDTKTVTIMDRDGKVVGRIAERGGSYQLRNPADVAFDGFGHVYVLDRAAVLVFSHDGSKLLTTFTVPEKTPGALTQAEAFALDSAARLYVFDDRAESVQIYR